MAQTAAHHVPRAQVHQGLQLCWSPIPPDSWSVLHSNSALEGYWQIYSPFFLIKKFDNKFISHFLQEISQFYPSPSCLPCLAIAKVWAAGQLFQGDRDRVCSVVEGARREGVVLVGALAPVDSLRAEGQGQRGGKSTQQVDVYVLLGWKFHVGEYGSTGFCCNLM